MQDEDSRRYKCHRYVGKTICITLLKPLKNLSRLSLGPLGGGTTLPEAVLESSVDVLKVGHSAGTAVDVKCIV